MPSSSTPKKPVIEERDGDRLSPRSGRQPSSILGLSIVSALNVASLGFIVYHFIVHPSEPERASDRLPVTSDVEIAEPPGLTQATIATSPNALGNVELARVPKHIISIALGLDLMDRERDDRRANISLASENLEDPHGVRDKDADEPYGHWVQLGALSKEVTARRYWSGLKQQHRSLLREREPRYFSPTEVGGSLYHIRLGPMAGDAAAGLCERLEAEGADCFCVSPGDDVAG